MDAGRVVRVAHRFRSFRRFRLDRIEPATVGERFEDGAGRTLRDMLQQIGPAAVRPLD